MFEHSVKVPRHYKIAANIFKKVSTEGGSVKSLLYDNKLRHFRTDVLFAIITETIKHVAEIDKIFESCSLLENEPRLDPWLAKILTTELLYGKKELPGKSKPEQTILSYREKFENYKSEHQDDTKAEATPRPRYIRVNTNLLTTSDAIRWFQDEEYRFIRCTSGSYDDYLEQVKNLTEYDFTQDYHVKTVFVFPPGTKFHNHELYLENKIILQNKASTLSVHLLAPPTGSVVLDMCAAPGMKTTQLAAYIRNNGKIYAVERNEKRYQILCDFVQKTASSSVQTIHRDCLEIKKGEYEDVEYIILDPSCSGSGMDISVHNYIEESRLAKLTSLQEKFLKHAMNSFPKAKRIVYSTCSMFPEENERVITNVVKTSRAKWRVQDVKELLKGQWNNFGSAMYGSMGTRCLYAKPEVDLTTGFFLAVLDRDQKDMEKSLKMESELAHKNKSKQEYLNFIDRKYNLNSNDSVEGVENFKPSVDKSDKKKKNKHSQSDDSIEQDNIKDNSNDISVNAKVKKHKKNKRSQPESDFAEPTVEDDVGCDTEQVVKKKKKKRDKPDDETENSVNGTSNRKHKLDIENLADNLNELVVDNLCDSGEPVKKKNKKKDKHKIVIEDSYNVDDKDELAQKSDEYLSQDVNSSELEIPVKKKKKRNKENMETESDQLQVDTEMVTDEPPKKKKKKHKRNENKETC
ncbi:28S rRNA (cytosine-C(5))-methyltransferase [Manduca sexta]|uniref:SAM-dependent MTase RsmB/NOP-type domain-containing protein n=1 Tax=Manduca sexta TaxID=7130 RepID=A0A921YNA9_MANSE|nr:28S rRNA (cytosine-C(5))-methyltransferase [Manduca sexta]KAG6442169.1 hypothetical protein O3G_MSEX002216 [Manduca sexta]